MNYTNGTSFFINDRDSIIALHYDIVDDNCKLDACLLQDEHFNVNGGLYPELFVKALDILGYPKEERDFLFEFDPTEENLKRYEDQKNKAADKINALLLQGNQNRRNVAATLKQKNVKPWIRYRVELICCLYMVSPQDLFNGNPAVWFSPFVEAKAEEETPFAGIKDGGVLELTDTNLKSKQKFGVYKNTTGKTVTVTVKRGEKSWEIRIPPKGILSGTCQGNSFLTIKNNISFRLDNNDNCRSIVRYCGDGGEIQLKSIENGSKFDILFPNGTIKDSAACGEWYAVLYNDGGDDKVYFPDDRQWTDEKVPIAVYGENSGRYAWLFEDGEVKLDDGTILKGVCAVVEMQDRLLFHLKEDEKDIYRLHFLGERYAISEDDFYTNMLSRFTEENYFEFYGDGVTSINGNGVII